VTRARHLLIIVVLTTVACTGNAPGGGGVNVGGETTIVEQPTTTTTVAPTTTSPPHFSIQGKVTRDDGTPVARAFVTMGDTLAISGADGWFSFETVEPQTMTVGKPGWSSVEVTWDEATVFYEATINPERIRGIRVSAEAAGDDAKFASLLQLADQTAINAMVFDSKQEGGTVLYDTGVAEAHEIGAVSVIYDPRARIEEAHAHDLYTITRIVTFEDAIRAAARPEEKLVGPWLDPKAETARAYILALAADACEIGFDEIQFDYIRYPSGSTAELTGQLDMTQDERVAVMADFLAAARELLHPMGCAVSADVYGIVVSTLDDQGIGQRPEELSAHIDALSPMVYPSHYSPGWIGFEDPNEHPYDVTADAITDALPRMEVGALLRPYLQAFYWTDEQIRRSIQAAEDNGVGWILWNVRSNYDRAAIPTDAELAP
jgi:hypothetical protein